MYKAAGRFNQSVARRGIRRFSPDGRRESTIVPYDDRPSFNDYDPRRLLIERLDIEVARVTPSLRKNPKIAQKRPVRPIRSDTISRKRQQKRVYLVRFILRANPDLTFIKIGISGIDIFARFQRDTTRYDLSVVGESEWLSHRDVLALETAIHRTFYRQRYRPPVPLASGNTECYLDRSPYLSRMHDIITAPSINITVNIDIHKPELPRIANNHKGEKLTARYWKERIRQDQAALADRLQQIRRTGEG